MNGPTPDQQRKRQQAYESVGKYWYTDFATKELRHKPLKGFAKFINVFWKTRHTVWEFYWWLARRRAEEDMMPFRNPIQSDNMPTKGFPMKYELQGGWTIPQSDRKYLMKGPLTSEGLSEILVPAAVGWRRLLLLLRQFGAVVVAVISIVGAVIRWWPELLEIFEFAF